MPDALKGKPSGQAARAIEELLRLNCEYCCKVEPDGRCYSEECMMNTYPEIREKIKEQGCRTYAMLLNKLLRTD